MGEAKDKIRRKENERNQCEKDLSDYNTNKQMIQSQTATKMDQQQIFQGEVNEMDSKNRKLEK